jgi:hypothetical protein
MHQPDVQMFFIRLIGEKFMNKFTVFELNGNGKATHLALIFLLLGIPITSLAEVQVAEESTVRNCQYLDKVEGSSGYGKNMNWQSLAKYSALSRAEKLGASHVVWEQFYPVGGFNGIATAKAYVCKS